MFLGFCGRAQLKLQTWFGIVFLAMSNICCSVACHLLGCTHWALSALWLVLDSEFWVLGPGSWDLDLRPPVHQTVSYPWPTKHFAGPCNIHACLGPASFDLFLDILFCCQRVLVKILVLCSFIYYHCFKSAKLEPCLPKVVIPRGSAHCIHIYIYTVLKMFLYV